MKLILYKIIATFILSIAGIVLSTMQVAKWYGKDDFNAFVFVLLALYFCYLFIKNIFKLMKYKRVTTLVHNRKSKTFHSSLLPQ